MRSPIRSTRSEHLAAKPLDVRWPSNASHASMRAFSGLIAQKQAYLMACLLLDNRSLIPFLQKNFHTLK